MRLFFAIFARDVPRTHALSGFRLVPPEQHHVTLLFVGEVPVWRPLAEVARQVAAGRRPFLLRFVRLVGLPTAEAARLVALEAVAEEAFTDLALRLRGDLAGFGQVAKERRPPRPHITLGRRRQAGCFDPVTLAEPWLLPVEGFSLVESRLGPAGPSYRELERYPLCAGFTTADQCTEK